MGVVSMHFVFLGHMPFFQAFYFCSGACSTFSASQVSRLFVALVSRTRFFFGESQASYYSMEYKKQYLKQIEAHIINRTSRFFSGRTCTWSSMHSSHWLVCVYITTVCAPVSFMSKRKGRKYACGHICPLYISCNRCDHVFSWFLSCIARSNHMHTPERQNSAEYELHWLTEYPNAVLVSNVKFSLLATLIVWPCCALFFCLEKTKLILQFTLNALF